MTALLSIDRLSPGDILLCYKDTKLNPINLGIKSVTNSDYTHAAICIEYCAAAQSTILNGVSMVSLHDLIRRYDHVAVFRQPDAWKSVERIQALSKFVNSVIASGAKYNLRDIVSFRQRLDVHEQSLTEQLDAYFQGKLAPSPVEKGSYFCSELVADCFVAVGFIEASAAIVYKSNATSPGALGRNPTFGTFLGYVSASPDYVVPSTDEFFYHSTYEEIFGN